MTNECGNERGEGERVCGGGGAMCLCLCSFPIHHRPQTHTLHMTTSDFTHPARSVPPHTRPRPLFASQERAAGRGGG